MAAALAQGWLKRSTARLTPPPHPKHPAAETTRPFACAPVRAPSPPSASPLGGGGVSDRRVVGTRVRRTRLGQVVIHARVQALGLVRQHGVRCQCHHSDMGGALLLPLQLANAPRRLVTVHARHWRGESLAARAPRTQWSSSNALWQSMNTTSNASQGLLCRVARRLAACHSSTASAPSAATVTTVPIGRSVWHTTCGAGA